MNDREQNRKEYPWFAYFQYGFHSTRVMTDKECEEAVKFYNLKPIENGFARHGRQPITILRRENT